MTIPAATDREGKHGASCWAVVLAGGDGSRLQSFTRDADGVAVPKQFCSLQGGPCLLDNAMQRASAVAPFNRVCVVVAAQHRLWWQGLFTDLPRKNVIVQPHNRGTAHGILLSLAQILARDPDAHVVLVPADHYLRDEGTLAHALRRAAELARAHDRATYLLGIEPDEPDTELDYVVAGTRRLRNGPSQVIQFVEKPKAAEARALLDRGALWNTSIAAGSIWALMRLFDASFSSTIVALSHRAEGRIEIEPRAFDRWYERLPTLDFSRDVLQGREALLQVLPVPRCGWTDLGTPHRLGITLERQHAARRKAGEFSFSSLADQYARLQLAANTAQPPPQRARTPEPG